MVNVADLLWTDKPAPFVAALLVRVTARVSAVILATNLLVAARRVGPATGGSNGPALRTGRAADIATFAAFIASHTIHFACVILLAIVSGGSNIHGAGGWTVSVIIAALFYAGCFAILRAKRRLTPRWTAAVPRRTELVLLVVLWLIFFQAYIGRFAQWWLFGVFATVLIASLGLFLASAFRPKPSVAESV